MSNRIIIIGATSAMAEHCARIWVQRPAAHITLVGRNKARTEAVAADLRVRNPHANVRVSTVDFLDPTAIQKLATSLCKEAAPNIVLIAHGTLPNQREAQDNLELAEQALTINGISPALFAEAFATPMEKAGHGTIAIIGSVAGDRGRKTNYIYGAAKGLVERFAEGLQHRLATTGVNVLLVKPGPTDTPMTTHLKQQGAAMASVESVASDIVKAIDGNKRVLYTPRKWQLIMLIIRHLPFAIFKKLNI